MKTSGILDLKFYSGDLDETITVRQFFYKILRTLWDEGESFSGKRPFGNSGWESDLVAGLIRAGVLEGELDEYGYIKRHDWGKSHKLIAEEIIPAIFNQIEYD